MCVRPLKTLLLAYFMQVFHCIQMCSEMFLNTVTDPGDNRNGEKKKKTKKIQFNFK